MNGMLGMGLKWKDFSPKPFKVEENKVFLLFIFFCLFRWFRCSFKLLSNSSLGLDVDFTFAWDNKNKKNNNKNNHKNLLLNFLRGTVLGDKEQGIMDKGEMRMEKGVGSCVKGQGIRNKTWVEFDTEDHVLLINIHTSA